MFTFILYVVLAVIFGYFATQNTQPVSITLIGATVSQIPLYLILGVTLVVGLLFSWLISLIDVFTASMRIRGKEHTIKDAKASIQDLKKKIQDLEVENAKLAGELKGTNHNSV